MIAALEDLNIELIDKRTENDGSICANFKVEPLERGFGITLGNTLRRICLSHLQGTAVTSVRIQGINHEFTAIKGVLEDAVEVILNIKNLVLKSELNEQFTMELNFKGPGDVKASNFTVPAGVTIVNPDLHILKVTENMDFSMEITASKGRGYVLADEHQFQAAAIDVIKVDSAFMPIRKFSYKIEQIRIGESSEASSNKYENLLIEMISNGAIEPDKALGQSARLLMEKLTPLMNLSGETTPVFTPVVSQVQQEQTKDNYADVGIETLNLSVRAYNCLKRANKNSLKDLLLMTSEEMMSIKNFGKKSAEEVIKILNDRGYYLSDDPRKNGGSPKKPEASSYSPSKGAELFDGNLPELY